MDREQAKLLLPIIKAFSEGETIQGKAHRNGSWNIDYGDDLPFEDLWDTSMFRIKPKPKYRPFKDMKECWNEMQKHQPFGWVKEDKRAEFANIVYVNPREIETHDNSYNYLSALECLVFADGKPFGIEEEKQ